MIPECVASTVQLLQGTCTERGAHREPGYSQGKGKLCYQPSAPTGLLPSSPPLQTTEGLSELTEGPRGRSQAGCSEGTTWASLHS